ncbi:hypothetical protein [Halorussus ruber]|uniref:hypothetical protein n=1 Tax=Halorussus ruber TaxID=1126238 RepID=UPI001091924D|nr:hypothetical protein [Halorussus ruber]
MSEPPEEPTPRLDAADRLERVIDAQSATLDSIDDKSGRIARLLGILLGVVLSSVSLSVQLSAVTLESLSTPTRLSFLAGVAFLLLSLATSILTLLSSRFRIGLTHATGDLLSHDEFDPELDEHLRHVVGTYAYNVRQNQRIIEANARWFKRSLVCFLAGESYLGVSVGLFFGGVSEPYGWVALGLSVPAIVGLVRYVLSDRYLTLNLQSDYNDY